MWALWMFIGILCGIGIGVAFMARRQRTQSKPLKSPKPTQTDKQVHKFYKHPWAPVAELRRVLPPPPAGHAWETKVVINPVGDHIMTLTLVEVSTGKNGASQSVNLTRHPSLGMSWETYWVRFRILGRDEYDRYIIRPLVDWAQRQINIRRAGENTEYSMDAGF